MAMPTTIVDFLAREGLSAAVEPWLYLHTLDRLAWVCLNDSKPLSQLILTPDQRSSKHETGDALAWDWTLLPDHDFSLLPWRSYIPLRAGSVRSGTHSWVFRKLSKDSLFDQSCPNVLRLHPRLKTNIRCTFRAARLICTSINHMYKLDIPFSMHPSLEWMEEDHMEETTLNAIVWDARRVVLELYGWASYHLLRDPHDWCKYGWDDGFVDLVKNLRILIVPRRGCIIDPSSTAPAEVATLVRHSVPVHYQWKGRNGELVVGGWIEPTGAGAQFDPYAFPQAYDYAAFLEAGGDYNKSAKDRSKLGRPSANELYKQFIRTKRNRKPLYNLPPSPKKCVGKPRMRYFVREFVGGQLTEISKQAMSDLKDEEAGELVTEKRPTGDMQLMTKISLSLPYQGVDLVKFFDELDSAELAKTALNEHVTNQVTGPVACQLVVGTDQSDPPVVGSNDVQDPHPTQPSIELLHVTPQGQSRDLAMDDDKATSPNASNGLHDFSLPSLLGAGVSCKIMPPSATINDFSSSIPEVNMASHLNLPSYQCASMGAITSPSMQATVPIFDNDRQTNDVDMEDNFEIDNAASTSGPDAGLSECDTPQANFSELDQAVKDITSEIREISVDHPIRQPSPILKRPVTRRRSSSSPRQTRHHHRSSSPGRRRRRFLSPRRHYDHHHGSLPPNRSSANRARSRSPQRYFSRRPRSPSPRGRSGSSQRYFAHRPRSPYPCGRSSSRQWSRRQSPPFPHQTRPTNHRESRVNRSQPIPHLVPQPPTPTPVTDVKSAYPACVSQRPQSPNGSSHYGRSDVTPPTDYQLPINSSGMTPLARPLDLHRKAAIEYISSSFPPSLTSTTFCGPSVRARNVILPVIPNHVLRLGRLTVPATTELRLRYWHLRDPSATLSDLLMRCLARGLPFRISLPNTFRTTSRSILLRGDPQYVDDSSTRLIQQRPGQAVSSAMINQYLDNVSEVLRRPQARHFVSKGGLLSRIVQEYSPMVYLEALHAPSPAAVDHGRLDLDEDGTHFSDLITPGEIKMLLGVTTNHNSLWPYPEQYEQSSKYNGEWTEANEVWFRRQADAIQYAKEGCLRSGRAWQNAIRPYTADECSSETTSGTAAHARACCAHLTRKWPGLWGGFSFTSFV